MKTGMATNLGYGHYKMGAGPSWPLVGRASRLANTHFERIRCRSRQWRSGNSRPCSRAAPKY